MSRKLAGLLVLVMVLGLLAACGGGGAPSSGGGGVEAGKAVFAMPAHGALPSCGTCHSLEPGKTVVGPSLAGVGTRAATAVSGQAAADYLRKSVVAPNDHVADGFQAGIMPSYEKDLTAQQLNDLVAYLASLK